MPEVQVEVGGRSYRLGCAEGEEAHLTQMAAMIDAEARKLSRQAGSVPEGRLMLMSALMIADRLHEAEAQIARMERKLAETRRLAEERAAGPDLFSPEREAALTGQVLALARRLEDLSAPDPD